MAINFFSPKDNDEERAMHSNSERIEIIIYDKADGNIEKNFSTFQLFNFFLVSNLVENIKERKLFYL